VPVGAEDEQVRQMIRDQKQVLDQIQEAFDARPEEIQRSSTP
jgi:hypothetical protein